MLVYSAETQCRLRLAEDILEVFNAENEVLVCMDETSKQHIKETRTPAPTRPGDAAKYDYEYERRQQHPFMLCAPLEGWRRVKVTAVTRRWIGRS